MPIENRLDLPKQLSVPPQSPILFFSCRLKIGSMAALDKLQLQRASTDSTSGTASECDAIAGSIKQPQVGVQGAEAPDKPILSPAKQGGSFRLRIKKRKHGKRFYSEIQKLYLLITQQASAMRLREV